VSTFSIASFNALWGLTVDHDPFDLVGAVAGFDADVLSLQEVWEPTAGPNVLDRVAVELGYDVVRVPLSLSTLDPHPQITADPEIATGTWGLALASRLPISRVKIVELGRLVERWDVAQRHALMVELDVGGQPVTVTAVHLSFVVPNAAAQLRRLNALLPVHQPSVVAGDCNLWGPLASAALSGHRRAIRARTWPADRPHSQLDHLLVSREVEVRAADVLPPAGSDHLPVRAVLDVGHRSR
jgi:endonuclease/exonuclease/phosphatase family metal-dependent hydrolase